MAIPTDYISHWSMDNITGSTLFDESANSYDGTINGATSVVAGHLNNALNFGGVDADYVDVGSHWDFVHTTGVFSISLWLRGTSFSGGNSAIIANTAAVTLEKGFILLVTPEGELRFDIVRGVSGQPLVSETSVGLGIGVVGDYQNIVVTGDGSGFKTFLNNVQVLTGTYGHALPTGAATRTLNLARANHSSVHLPLDGRLDEVRIYDRELSATERLDLYNEGASTISGTITETLGATNWHVRSHKTLDGELSSSVETSSGNYTLHYIGSASEFAQTVVCMADQGDVWVKDSAVIVNQLLFPPDPATTSYYYKVTVAGTSGSTEPAWSTTPGATFADGSATLECIERLIQPQVHSPIMPQ